MLDAPSAEEIFHQLGGEDAGTVGCENVWDAPACSILPENFYHMSRVVTFEAEDAQPTAVAIDNGQVCP